MHLFSFLNWVKKENPLNLFRTNYMKSYTKSETVNGMKNDFKEKVLHCFGKVISNKRWEMAFKQDFFLQHFPRFFIHNSVFTKKRVRKKLEVFESEMITTAGINCLKCLLQYSFRVGMIGRSKQRTFMEAEIMKVIS